MKKLIPFLLVLAALLTLPACGKTPEPAPTQPDSTTAYTTKSFGGYTWRVLDEQDDKLLLITEDIIELRPYNAAYEDVTWETCTLRAYLNGEFYSKFSEQEQAMILETRNTNLDNQWFETDGGNDTMDKVFLLSLEEVVKYFGDSGQLKNRPEDIWRIDDQYNSKRVAKFSNDKFRWLLRSPGYSRDYVTFVSNDGFVRLYGIRVDEECGVRPALWIKL